MKVLIVLGTRPEIIRFSRIVPLLDQHCRLVLVHTGQNFDVRLSDIFFRDLEMRAPDHHLDVRAGSFGAQLAQMVERGEAVLAEERPDRVLILGDTNSGLLAVVAKRMGIPVFHMEAGNRCFDDRVPEEINRRVIDHSSDILMPYTERSRANLLREGITGERIFVTGNPILEVIEHYEPKIASSSALADLGVNPNRFVLVTMHRAENVDVERRLTSLTEAVQRMAAELDLPVIVSTHPHTQARLEQLGRIPDAGRVRFLPPFGFMDFVSLEKQAACVVSDSGTVQEECAVFGVPNVTIRDVTERPETIECGSNMLCGADADTILRSVRMVMSLRNTWTAPPEYRKRNVSETVARIVLEYHRLEPRGLATARGI